MSSRPSRPAIEPAERRRRRAAASRASTAPRSTSSPRVATACRQRRGVDERCVVAGPPSGRSDPCGDRVGARASGSSPSAPGIVSSRSRPSRSRRIRLLRLRPRCRRRRYDAPSPASSTRTSSGRSCRRPRPWLRETRLGLEPAALARTAGRSKARPSRVTVASSGRWLTSPAMPWRRGQRLGRRTGGRGPARRSAGRAIRSRRRRRPAAHSRPTAKAASSMASSSYPRPSSA